MPRSEYVVTLTVGETDTLRRVSLLNSAMFRVLEVSELRRVIEANYAEGRVELLVLAEEATPELVPGEVTIKVREAGST